MNYTVRIDHDMFSDWVCMFLTLGLIEKNNPDFLPNKSESWKELIESLERKALKVQFIQRFFRIKPIRRQRFKQFQQILYSKNRGTATMVIMNEPSMKVAENWQESVIDSVVEETLKAITNKETQLPINKLNEIKSRVKANLKHRRIL